MRKYLLTLAVVALASLTATAEHGAPPAPGAGGPEFGWNPIMKKILWWKKDKGDCKGCASGTTYPAPPGVPQFSGGPYGTGPGMPGTLVFPNHQFIRSPRDFFMTGQGGN
jgi:hypothetical protein